MNWRVCDTKLLPVQKGLISWQVDVNSTRVKSLRTQIRIRADGVGRERLATRKRHDINIANSRCPSPFYRLLISD